MFSKDVLTRMLTEIYEGLNVKDNIQRDAFFETLRIFNKATDEGLADSSVNLEKEFLQAIRTNNEVFSAFRVHRMQNDMAEQLLDEEGKLKPFEKWLKDIQTISDHYVRRWLETEYNTAVIRAHNAAEWKRYESETDVMPNLRWMPTTSPIPDNLHRQYWSMKLTLPVNHPFWEKHRPGDRWNCKCWLKQTDEPESGSVEFEELKPVEPVTGLDNNPGKDGKIFSDSHPYYTEVYPGVKKAVKKIINWDDSYEIVPTKAGKLRVHIGHGKNEREENIKIGKYLSEKYGYEIDLIDNPANKKSPDSYNKTLKVYQEYKMNKTPTKNSIDNLLRDAKKQAEDIVLWIDSDIPFYDLEAAIHSRVNRSENIQYLTIIKDGKCKRFSREEIISKAFKIRPTELK